MQLTFFWLQDSVVLLKELPELADIKPWSTMLSDASAYEAFQEMAEAVDAALRQFDVETEKTILSQEELLKSVAEGCTLTAHHIAHRLQSLPFDLLQSSNRAWELNLPSLQHSLSNVVEASTKHMLRTLATNLSQQLGERQLTTHYYSLLTKYHFNV